MSNNDYNLILFLDERGRAEVGKEDLLRSARADAASFLMDYADLTTGYAGRITAEVLGVGEIQRALAAYAIYKDTGTYPAGYRGALSRARRIATSKATCTMVVEQCVDAADRPRCATSKRQRRSEGAARRGRTVHPLPSTERGRGEG